MSKEDGYKAILISTIVDFISWLLMPVGYKAILISTIVDTMRVSYARTWL